jgi:general secretion pathway protein M
MNDSVRHRYVQLSQTLGLTWSRLAARERLALVLAAAVVGLALLWWLGLAPALATLRQAPQQHRALDAQLAHMRAMAASAQALRGQGSAQPLAREAVQRALDQATRDLLGPGAQQNLQGDQATIVLNAVPPDALARWLEQVRINARLVPVQADLRFTPNPAGWSGQLVLAGPGLGAGN